MIGLDSLDRNLIEWLQEILRRSDAAGGHWPVQCLTGNGWIAQLVNRGLATATEERNVAGWPVLGVTLTAEGLELARAADAADMVMRDG